MLNQLTKQTKKELSLYGIEENNFLVDAFCLEKEVKSSNLTLLIIVHGTLCVFEICNNQVNSFKSIPYAHIGEVVYIDNWLRVGYVTPLKKHGDDLLVEWHDVSAPQAFKLVEFLNDIRQ